LSEGVVNLTPVGEILGGIVDIMPNLVEFVIAILPVLIVIILITFIASFFDRIVGLLKIKI